jgi:hypothetical protein
VIVATTPPLERFADRAALVGAALFVALIILFGIDSPAALSVFGIAVVAVAAHLALLPVVAAMPAPNWARAAGYGWLAIDVILNIASLNGAEEPTVTSFRLGGHILAATWIGTASSAVTGPVRPTGLLLAALLVVHAFAAPWLPFWAIYPPFLLIPVWLGLSGRWLAQMPVGAGA